MRGLFVCDVPSKLSAKGRHQTASRVNQGGTNSRFFDLVVQVSGALIAPMTLGDRPRLSVWEIAVRAAMQTKIGQELRARYEVPQDIPRDMRVLLKDLDTISKSASELEFPS
jgi:hypothetical protein